MNKIIEDTPNKKTQSEYDPNDLRKILLNLSGYDVINTTKIGKLMKKYLC